MILGPSKRNLHNFGTTMASQKKKKENKEKLFSVKYLFPASTTFSKLKFQVCYI